MKRAQTMKHLLLACLLLAASQHQIVQAIEPDAKLRTAEVKDQAIIHGVSASWEKTGQTGREEDEKSYRKGKIHKAPSGPNPVGNRLPPALP